MAGRRLTIAKRWTSEKLFHFPPILTSPKRSALLYTAVSGRRREPGMVRSCPAAKGRDCAARGDCMPSRVTLNFGRTDWISRKAPIANGSIGDSRPSTNGEIGRLGDLGLPNVPRGTLGGAKSDKRDNRASTNGDLTDQKGESSSHRYRTENLGEAPSPIGG